MNENTIKNAVLFINEKYLAQLLYYAKKNQWEIIISGVWCSVDQCERWKIIFKFDVTIKVRITRWTGREQTTFQNQMKILHQHNKICTLKKFCFEFLKWIINYRTPTHQCAREECIVRNGFLIAGTLRMNWSGNFNELKKIYKIDTR